VGRGPRRPAEHPVRPGEPPDQGFVPIVVGHAV
jgi:hypothetical protein